MALHPRGTLLILAAACGLATLAAGQSESIQAPAAAFQRQQNAQPATQVPDPTSAQTEERALYRHILLVRFSYFLEYVGRESFLIENEGREKNPQQFVERTDYESGIGIGDGEEQVMLEIVRDAGPQIIESWDQIDAATMKFLEQHGSGENMPDDPELKALIRKQEELVRGTSASLKTELGTKALRKLDAYVFREFIDREGPVSENNIASLREPNDAFASGQVPPGGSRLSDMRSFAIFFQIPGASDERMGREAEGEDMQGNILRLDIPKDEKQIVLHIVRGANHQIIENIRRGNAVIGEYHQRYGPQPIPHPLPAGLAMLNSKFWAIINENRAKLRQALGEEDFKKFDESVNQVFGEREMGAVPDLASQPKPLQARRDSAPVQTP